MWSRRELKARAKETLRSNYWRVFLVALVLMIVGGVNVSGPFDLENTFRGPNQPSNVTFDSQFDNFMPPDLNNMPQFKMDVFDTERGFNKFRNIPFLPWFVGAAAFGIVIFLIAAMIVWRIFLGYPMEVGCRKYFIKASTDEAAYNQMTYCFNNQNYWNVVKTMFMRSLFNFLWFLALIVPGIIKSYAYSMVPFILSENPNMPYDEAIDLSQKMTLGHKLDMWILDLSFLGWYLLGMIFFGLGGVFVNPYYESTKAELYLVLSDAAIEMGACRPEALNRTEVETL